MSTAYLYTGRDTGWQTIAFTNDSERDSFVHDMTHDGWTVASELPDMIGRQTRDALGRLYYPEGITR
jgi:hypothetical protein